MSINHHQPPFKRRLCALLCLAGLAALPPATHAAEPDTASARNAPRVFDIPPGALSEVLARYAASAGVALSFDAASLRQIQSPGLKGNYTVQQGFDRLLAGSSLEAVQTSPGDFALRKLPQSWPSETTLSTITVSGKGAGSTTEGSGSYTTWSTSSSTRLNLTPQETPQAITVMTRQRLNDQNLRNLVDALEAVPGIIVQKTLIGEGQDGTDIYARGSRLRNYQIDGVPTSLAVGPFLSNTAAYDRIEVVRGATGIMNGLGSPAATINLIRKRPTATPQKSVTTQAGNWDRHGVGMDLSGALNESATARGRLVADYDRQGAWVKHFDQENLTLYGIAEFDLSDQTQLTIGFNHLDQKTDSTILGNPLFYTNGQRTKLSPSDDGTPAWSYYDHESNNLFASLEHRFGTNWVGKVEYSQTRYEDDALTVGIPDSVDAATGNGVEVWPYRWSSTTRQNNLDAYMSGVFSLFGRDHELIGGVTLSRSRSSTNLYDYDWMNYPADFNLRDWKDTAPAPDFFRTGKGGFRERQYSAYLNARFQLSDATSLLLGGRSAHWQLDEGSGKRTEDVFVPYVGLVHALNDIWSVYGSYTKIFQPQDGVVFLYGRPGASPDPEQGEGYEAGIKASLNDGQLTTNLAVFQMDVSNLAFWNRDTRFYEVHGETQTRGVELEVNGKLAEGWQAGAGYAYARTEDENGQRTLTRLPLHNLKLFTTYHLPGAWNKLTLGGGVNWQSTIRSGAAIDYRQGSVALVNLMARYEVNRNLSVSFNLNNALDKQYFSTVASNFGTFGAPRNFMASAKYSF
ncbi:TonB-dependent siderophore receptor [Thauera linaloolentis]|uniref:TonB-dependent outermembrane ferripyoverdine receptor n=1 Tax=Thauera linaloolentis (strain DSM 12138 / JCM 21573 / CCUG 41526 / CIP 105981 / IAM 15112 / NBRC 102519 / 47Lol) TaxID=1123367 RepID=N6ZE85_THAL4|nr:TonB-dependent siderophore receptor [Thauera linaloolentis]ENO90469.1 TonB-dependent outermembrane ferripyoverdine receptor [Thauera linaloolentis 47Lol = DSM 12138]MCM8566330.1 TonB-dependent siderophore receptor [Thauera linaloolentis]